MCTHTYTYCFEPCSFLFTAVCLRDCIVLVVTYFRVPSAGFRVWGCKVIGLLRRRVAGL